ncbi:MAG TPA: hypothetical protein VF683_00030, partial [Chthoniobacterales bacterium]
MKREPTPLGRAQRALELVQDKVRYLAVDMNGGNYIPQKPARTWEVRYGDCKAKTLLLLGILHAMQIEAEPVLANIGAGDLVPQRLPSAQAFNHVLVRASIAGDSLWLDGTGAGSRLADIHDTPPLGHVLPVRLGGADLIEIAFRADARPMVDLSVEADESASSDLPSVFNAVATVRGPDAAMLPIAASQVGEKEKRKLIAAFFQRFLGEAQISEANLTPDPAGGLVKLVARGVVTSPWTTAERKRKRSLTSVSLEFSPDRGRPAWQAIPVAMGPMNMRYRLRLRLPEGGRGYAVEGEPDLKARLAGYDIVRTTRVESGIVTVDERIDWSRPEIPAAEIAGERDKVATAKARSPKVVAPENYRRRWDLTTGDLAGSTQVKGIEETFAKAIANDPDEMTGYQSRASYRIGIGDRRGALGDLTRAIALAPSIQLYLQRASVNYELGNAAAAAADAEAARQ